MIKFEKIIFPDTGKTVMDELVSMNATVRFSPRPNTLKRDAHGGWETVTSRKDVAEILDLTTNEFYASGCGDDEETAVINAVRTAKASIPPLTAAQKSNPAFNSMAEELRSAKQRLAELEAAAAKQPTKRTAPVPQTANEAR